MAWSELFLYDFRCRDLRSSVRSLFAERNLSLALFGLILLFVAMVGALKPMRATLLIILAGLANGLLVFAEHLSERGSRRVVWEARNVVGKVGALFSAQKAQLSIDDVPRGKRAFGLVYYGNDYWRRVRAFLRQHEYKVVGRYRSRFWVCRSAP